MASNVLFNLLVAFPLEVLGELSSFEHKRENDIFGLVKLRPISAISEIKNPFLKTDYRTHTGCLWGYPDNASADSCAADLWWEAVKASFLTSAA